MTDIIVYGRGKTGLALANLAKKLGLPLSFTTMKKVLTATKSFRMAALW